MQHVFLHATKQHQTTSRLSQAKQVLATKHNRVFGLNLSHMSQAPRYEPGSTGTRKQTGPIRTRPRKLSFCGGCGPAAASHLRAKRCLRRKTRGQRRLFTGTRKHRNPRRHRPPPLHSVHALRGAAPDRISRVGARQAPRKAAAIAGRWMERGFADTAAEAA
jgi:hypothetical protein